MRAQQEKAEGVKGKRADLWLYDIRKNGSGDGGVEYKGNRGGENRPGWYIQGKMGIRNEIETQARGGPGTKDERSGEEQTRVNEVREPSNESKAKS